MPTFLLARYARREVKVVLVGEGGDELFAGYPTYLGGALAAAVVRACRSPSGARWPAAAPRLGAPTGNTTVRWLLRRFLEAAERRRPQRASRLDRLHARRSRLAALATPGGPLVSPPSRRAGAPRHRRSTIDRSSPST